MVDTTLTTIQVIENGSGWSHFLWYGYNHLRVNVMTTG